VGSRRARPPRWPPPRPSSDRDEPQVAVDEHFDRRSDYWRDVYGGDSAESLAYRERMETALAWVDQLNLPAGASALDVGCGAGLMTVELAARGMR